MGEVACARGGNQGLQFTDQNSFDFRMHDEGSGCDPSAATDHQNRAWLGMEQGREVSEHPLKAHILRECGGFDLAANMKEASAIWDLSDGDGRVPALAHIERAAVLVRYGQLASIREHLP